MKKSLQNLLFPLLILGTFVTAGCGYRFPGDPVARAAVWKNTSIKIEGAGKKQHPILAQILKEKLTQKLGISQDSSSATNNSATLHIELKQPERELILEDREGRADQYQITITAKPSISGRQNAPNYPTVSGRTTYYELRASATSQTAKNSAQTEALNSLADALVAVLSSQYRD